MPTSFVRGDLFADSSLDGLAHGCNCAGAMGKGIAVEFRSRFPAMYREYKTRCSDGRFALGGVFVWHHEGLAIFNLGIQRSWRGSGAKPELTTIESTVATMIEVAQARSITRVGLPRIGAGLGGLAWPDVRSILARLGDASTVQLVVFEHYARGQAGH